MNWEVGLMQVELIKNLQNLKTQLLSSQPNTYVNPKYPRFILLKRGRVQQFVMTLQEDAWFARKNVKWARLNSEALKL